MKWIRRRWFYLRHRLQLRRMTAAQSAVMVLAGGDIGQLAEQLARGAGVPDEAAVAFARAWTATPPPVPGPLPAWDMAGRVKLDGLGE